MTDKHERIVVACGTCGKTLQVALHIRLRQRNYYCSRACFYSNTTRRDFFACEQCGGKFAVPKGIVNEHRRSGKPDPRYCSNACHNLARMKRVIRSCGICGNEFSTIPAEIRKGGGKFCSRKCFDEYRRTSKEYFRQLRKKASCKPNGAEISLLDMFPDDIRFTGDGDLWLVMPNGRHRNPDFKVNDQKKVIEVFGSPFHSPSEEKEAIDDYNAIGWGCLVVWASSLSSSRKKNLLRPVVQQFILS